MREKMTETKDGMSKGSWRRALSGVVAGGIVASTIAGCVESPTKTQTVNPTPTLEASPISGTGEFSVLFTPNSLQNLDAEAKAIVSKNLELINQECNQDLPGRMMPGSEKYLFARNKSNETFIWGFCDVASADAPAKTMVSMFDWTAGPSGETTKIYKNLEYFEADGTMGYVDDNGVSHAILKINNDNMIEVYDINEKVVAQQAMTPEAIGFFDGVKNVNAEPLPTATIEPTATVEVDKYAYSKERLFNTIPSYEYFQAHPEKVAWAPYDPWTDPENFNNWLKGDLTTDLGDLSKLDYNVQAGYIGHMVYDVWDGVQFAGMGPFLSQPPIFGVRHEGVEYPVLVLKIKGGAGEDAGTHAILLYNGSYDGRLNADGCNALTTLNDKNRELRSIIFLQGSNYYSTLPVEINQLIALGYNAFTNGFPQGQLVASVSFGPGIVKFW